MRVVPTDGRQALDLRGHTLVLPGCGSLAHLGELCVDALVTNFGLERAAIVQSRHLLPMVSASAWQAPGAGGLSAITCAAEVYQSAQVPNLTVLQLRSEVLEGRRNALSEELWAWAREQGVAEVIIVSSCSSHVKVDADFGVQTQLRYVQIGGDGEAPLGDVIVPLGHALREEDIDPEHSRDVSAVFRFLRGGGLARPLVLLAANEAEEPAKGGEDFSPPPRAGKSPSLLCLLGLTTEALNIQVTELLAKASCNVLAQKLKASPASDFTAPPSWTFQMECTPLDRRLWG